MRARFLCVVGWLCVWCCACVLLFVNEFVCVVVVFGRVVGVCAGLIVRLCVARWFSWLLLC